MNKLVIYKIFSASLFTVLFMVGCQKDIEVDITDDDLPVLTGQTIVVPAIGESVSFKVETNDSWVASTDAPWILITPANGVGSASCKLVVDSTLMNNLRSEHVRITYTSTNESDLITVEQEGFPRSIDILSDSSVTLPNYANLDERYFDVELSTNVDFEIVNLSELTWIDDIEVENYSLDRGARPRNVGLQVYFSNHTNPTSDRDCILQLRSSDDGELIEVQLPISQAAGDLIPNTIEGDSLALLAIARNINSYFAFDSSEPMKNWSSVELWEITDSELSGYLDDRLTDEEYQDYTREQLQAEVLGRVKSALFYIFDTEEDIPYEVRYLKHCVDLDFSSNTNHELKEIGFGESLGELVQLKRLTLFACGVHEFEPTLSNLKRLESLSLAANHFATIPSEINPTTFPRLTSLSFSGNILTYYTDLSTISEGVGDIGLEMSSDDLERLFEWDNLESLSLSYNYNYGELPTMDHMPTYTQEQIEKSDTLSGANILLRVPRVLPNCTDLRLNLNRFTGDLPEWILYHPNLMFYDAFTLIFNQEGRNREGVLAGFDNEPSSFQYYYNEFPFWAEVMGQISDEEVEE
ncbi:MAG: BACON domain-containing carbohydrate-binding protein [Rikenellaceae bacterium]